MDEGVKLSATPFVVSSEAVDVWALLILGIIFWMRGALRAPLIQKIIPRLCNADVCLLMTDETLALNCVAAALDV